MSAATPTDPHEGAATSKPQSEYLFVRRPVLAGVISIVVALLGFFAMWTLPLNRYPQITPPAVQVTAVYPGASAQDVASAVAAPIEQQLSGLDGLLYYKSSNASDGTMNLSLYFDISRDQDLAAVDVQNAVNVATPQLPAAVRQNGITITKANSDILMVAALTSTDPRYDASYLSNYAKVYLENEIKRVPGVGNARVFGSLDFAMLLSLDPEKMAQLGITVDDVAAAVQRENATKPAGRIGREPAPVGTQLTLPVTTTGRLTTPAEFASIVVRARPDGSIVHVGDIANVHLGSQGYDAVGRLNGKATALFLVYARPGANNLDVKKAVLARMDELSKAFPAGVRYEAPFDTTPFITESIKEVVKTLAEAMLLVTLVVFVFLQSWRATLIPVLAVPVSIIGTFLGLQFLGFTINTLTLFGMVLAIGIVVDDAIVVIENVERIMAQEHVSPREATNRAMRQVGGALVAIVLVLCSVFIPVAFVGGITGAMYKQFAVTIVISVVLSGMVALTLTPALCAMLLQHAPEETDNRFFRRFNEGFAKLTLFGRVVEDHRSPARVGRRLRRDARAGVRAVACGAGRLPSERGQGVLRDRGAAPRRGVAAAHAGRRRAHREHRPQGAHGRQHRRAGRTRHPVAVEPDQRRDDVRESQAVGRAHGKGRSARRDPRAHQWQARRHQGSDRLRLQPPRDSRTRDDERTRGEPAGSRWPDHPAIRRRQPGRPCRRWPS